MKRMAQKGHHSGSDQRVHSTANGEPSWSLPASKPSSLETNQEHYVWFRGGGVFRKPITPLYHFEEAPRLPRGLKNRIYPALINLALKRFDQEIRSSGTWIQIPHPTQRKAREAWASWTSLMRLSR